MDFAEINNQIETELEEIAQKELANQQEQIEILQQIEELTQNIEQLKQEIAQKNHRQSELDSEALELCSRSEELNEKKQKIAKIQSFSEEFQGLQAEFQDNKDLLDTLYSSISAIAVPNDLQYNFYLEDPSLNIDSDRSETDGEANLTEFNFSIEEIKTKLPHAEKLYQQLVAKNLEQYHTYQNLIINGLDLIWFAVGFVAFGKNSYKKMSLKYHPDLNGSEIAMQLINTAWEISQSYLQTEHQ